eukprot:CAMPEP_0115875028 /NCGR_PEP_ID=MMETSP0287-20121206/24870_1 /TAXON_ID=412157 /ORGANISM="Chrysochromulina rotalis, Strain UIO044" /LENGTH=243 /DNA_ID=CAMNT_0003330247 /DNA_START=26 /DNA_END=755 /DNA_ORIENTATION=+
MRGRLSPLEPSSATIMYPIGPSHKSLGHKRRYSFVIAQGGAGPRQAPLRNAVLQQVGPHPVELLDLSDPSAASDATLVAAAVLVDQEHSETAKALATAADRSAVAARLHAARVLLWCGVEAYCHSHVDPAMPYVYPLRAAPRVLVKHGPFLAWRGMKESAAGSPLARLDGPVHWEWPRIRLGCDEDWWDIEAMGDEEDDDGFVDQPLPAAELQAAREAAAENLGDEGFDVDQEDADSEYETLL